ncbi:MAG TPA: HNH endonuclease, partial [Ktedonobacteraceae bacterium]|nr:HNH endonuclease [Ktedonobacteraceae bacterium]
MSKRFSLLGLMVLLVLILCSCTVNVTSGGGSTSGGTSSGGSTPTGGQPNFGVQTKTSGCVAHGGLPDSACTPGAIFPNATKSEICRSG